MMGAEIAECYAKHSDALLRFAASQVGASDADDVLSAALVGVLQRGTDGVVDPGSYLYRAVANAALKHWRDLDRRRRRDMSLVTRPLPSHESHDPRVSSMVDSLAKLSVQQRAVVHLTYWEDLTPAAVAERLGVSDGTVRRQLARARERLRKELRSDG